VVAAGFCSNMRVLRRHVRLVLTWEVASGYSQEFYKTALAVQAVLLFSPCHLLEHSNLPEEVSYGLSRASKNFSVRSDIRNDARLRSDLRTLTDPKMPGHSCLPADTDEIFKHGRTRNTDLCDDDTTPAEDNIVADLHEVIDTGASADHRVS